VAKRSRSVALLTTEKDEVRLSGADRSELPILAVQLATEIEDESEAIDALLEKIVRP
jgi:tetraacyldisaccharide-1-P 4'-kinase